MQSRIFSILAPFAAAVLLLVSCIDKDALDSRLDALEKDIAELEEAVKAANDNAVAISRLLKDNTLIVGVTNIDNGYILELEDGMSVKVIYGVEAPKVLPVIGIDEDGYWVMSMDGGETFTRIAGCENSFHEAPETPQVRIDADGYWCISIDGGKTWNRIVDSDGKPVSAVDGKEIASVKTYFTDVRYSHGADQIGFTLLDGKSFSVPVVSTFYLRVTGYEEKAVIYLNETLRFEVEASDVAEAAFQVPSGWAATLTDGELSVTAPVEGEAGEYHVGLVLVSSKGYLKHLDFIFTLNPVAVDATACTEWNHFVTGDERNILVDFSYAGYMHGETAPADVYSLGYEIYDVKEYGAVPGDGKSDRQAFLDALEAALGKYEIIDGCLTFPHREKADAVIYFPEGEYILHDEDDDVNGSSRSIIVRAGNFVIKGAGRDLTTIVMDSPMQPADEAVLYSSPDMLQIKHFSSLSQKTVVSADSSKGAFEVSVTSADGISAGDWVCLYINNSEADFVARELAPYAADASWDISTQGVKVIDYHQVRAVLGSKVIFCEPLMHEVNHLDGWELMTYPHYEGVGVEDLTFKGHAKTDFVHHGSWEDDGAYKPLSLNRLVNSWVRRVGFESVSEACSIINSANVSAYDITMTGNRGHAAVRAQASSRVLIAGTSDQSSEGTGNYHGVGVSEHSIGTVLWRNVWGDDSCFESHARQPRATLIDCCEGGWHKKHQGGDRKYFPHHLADLTVWNFTATSASSDGQFTWWDAAEGFFFLKPVIVGFQSAGKVSFDPSQTLVVSTHDMQASPESLYEAQLRKRLGAVPAWLNTLKSTIKRK